MKRCMKCGAVVALDGKFCPECGSSDLVIERTNQNIYNNSQNEDEQEIPNHEKSSGISIAVIIAILIICGAGISYAFFKSVNDDNKIVTSQVDDHNNGSDEYISSEEKKIKNDNSEESSEINEPKETEDRLVDTNVVNEEALTWKDYTELEGDVPAFYGIWCAASKSKMEAINIAQEIVGMGFAAQVFYSDNWSGLAEDGWYIVSAGSYDSEQEASIVLLQVREYYPGAYIKYSGSFVDASSKFEIADEHENADRYEDNNMPNNIVEYEDDTAYANCDYASIECLITEATTRELSERDLLGYSSFELSAARNGIYAIHGYIFNTQKWNEFFTEFAWYKPNPSFRQENLNSVENKNAGFIRKYEEEKYGKIYTFD